MHALVFIVLCVEVFASDSATGNYWGQIPPPVPRLFLCPVGRLVVDIRSLSGCPVPRQEAWHECMSSGSVVPPEDECSSVSSAALVKARPSW